MGGLDKGDTVKNFLKTLADNNRLGILHGVCEQFATLMGAARGEMDLTITSAQVILPRSDFKGWQMTLVEIGSKDVAET